MKKYIQKIKELIKKYEEIIRYLIIGVLITILNYAIFAVLTTIIKMDMHASNLIAWLISVIAAYITNKIFVFESKSFKFEVLSKEILSFGAARIFSLLLEEAILFIFVDLLLINKLIIKLIANIIVVIVNYILSKFVIFKSHKKQ